MLLKEIFAKKLTEETVNDNQNNDFVNPEPKDNVKHPISNKNEDSFNDFIKYLNEVNPETGQPYRIPYLSPLDPDYELEYVRYMKLKEENEELFNRIMEWK